jgi:hypothetical protein
MGGPVGNRLVEDVWSCIVLGSALGLFAGLVSGCCSYSDHVSAKAIRPAALKIIQRHDAYISSDQSLDQFKARTFLRTSEGLQGVLDQAAGVTGRGE